MSLFSVGHLTHLNQALIMKAGIYLKVVLALGVSFMALDA